MNVLVTLPFEREMKRLVKKYPSLRSEFATLVESLQENPFQGVALGQDCYKVRIAIASKGRGKSGGGRVITCVKIIADSIYLLSIYDKSAQETIEDKALDKLLELAGLL